MRNTHCRHKKAHKPTRTTERPAARTVGALYKGKQGKGEKKGKANKPVVAFWFPPRVCFLFFGLSVSVCAFLFLFLSLFLLHSLFFPVHMHPLLKNKTKSPVRVAVSLHKSPHKTHNFYGITCFPTTFPLILASPLPHQKCHATNKQEARLLLFLLLLLLLLLVVVVVLVLGLKAL
jgi:hypothetical protein